MRDYKNLILKAFAAVLFILIAYNTFYQYSANFFIDNDNIKIYRLVQERVLPWFTGINPPNYFTQQTRPFAGFAWNIAGILGGGSRIHYYYFHFSYLVLSSILLVFTINRLFPKYLFMAIIAGFFKLVWSSDHQVYSNVCIQIAFAEVTFFISLYLFVLVLTSKLENKQLIVTFAFAILFQIISSGVYEMVWHLHALLPILILFAKKKALISKRNLHFAGIWYAFLFTYVVLYFLNNFNLLPSISQPATNQIKKDLFWGIQVSDSQYYIINSWVQGTIDSSYETLKFLYKNVRVSSNLKNLDSQFYVINFILFFVLYFFKKRFPNISFKNAGIGFIFSFLLIVSGVILPSFSQGIGYGNRLIHFSSYGAILALVLVLPLLQKIKFFSNLFITIFCSFIIFSSMMTLKLAALSFGSAHSPFFSYWRGVFHEIPNLKENSVLIIKNPPFREGTIDFSDTEYIRNFMRKECIFYFNTATNNIREEKDNYKILTTLSYPNQYCLNKVEKSNSEKYYGIVNWPFWTIYWDKKEATVPKNRVVFIDWDNDESTARIDLKKSNLSLIDRDNTDKYIENLLDMNSYKSLINSGQKRFSVYTPTFSDLMPRVINGHKIFSENSVIGYFKDINRQITPALIQENQLKEIIISEGHLVIYNPRNTSKRLSFEIIAEVEKSLIVIDSLKKELIQVKKNQPIQYSLLIPKGKSEVLIRWNDSDKGNRFRINNIKFVE